MLVKARYLVLQWSVIHLVRPLIPRVPKEKRCGVSMTRHKWTVDSQTDLLCHALNDLFGHMCRLPVCIEWVPGTWSVTDCRTSTRYLQSDGSDSFYDRQLWLDDGKTVATYNCNLFTRPILEHLQFLKWCRPNQQRALSAAQQGEKIAKASPTSQASSSPLHYHLVHRAPFSFWGRCCRGKSNFFSLLDTTAAILPQTFQ